MSIIVLKTKAYKIHERTKDYLGNRCRTDEQYDAC
jgi:hypothetical protein